MRATFAESGRLGTFAYVIAGASFLPPFGILIGGIAAVWGTHTRRSGGTILASLGALGLAFSIFVSVMFVERLSGVRFVELPGILSETYDEAVVAMTEAILDDMVQEIEFHRVQHGVYPDYLHELDGYEGGGWYIDPMSIGFRKKRRTFYYGRVDADHYYLRSVGRDGVPYTADDIFPTIEILPGSRVGLLKEPPRQVR